ncbi:hypothetical protein Tco_0918153 [Tanacetum coccineum]
MREELFKRARRLYALIPVNVSSKRSTTKLIIKGARSEENEVFQDMQLIQKLRGDQKCMKKVVPSSRSKATKDIISIGSFVEVPVLNHYVLVKKILGKLSKLHDEVAQNKTNIQEPRKPW